MCFKYVFARLVTPLSIAVLAFGVTACGGGGGGESSPPVPPPTVFTPNSVKQALDYAVDQGVDGIWVYIDEGDGQPRVETSGISDKSTNEPATANSQFKIASISKLFIAVSATKLAAQGVLQLDDTLSFWLPALNGRIENASSITLRQLLQHRSGVPDFDSQFGFSWLDAHTDNDALLALVLDKPADFAPNAQYEYSNTNYLLLGMILDTALGYSHHDHIQNSILSPLGMMETFALQSDTDSALMAHGYWDNVDRIDQEYVAPGGSMVSIARDTGVFMRELSTGSLLTDDERAIYTSLFDSFAHSGWLPGYQSIARFSPATNTVLVQFVNTTGGNSEAVSSEVYNLILEYLRTQ